MHSRQSIVFRADGNQTIGWGHLFRCFSLVENLGTKFQYTFYSYNPPAFITEVILSYKASIVELKSEDEDHNEFISSLKGSEIIVLDGYSFTPEVHQRIRNKKSRLVCIDDLHDLFYDVDAVINHSPGITSYDYTVSQSTRLYLGLDYALIRKPFYQLSQCSRKAETITSAFVCFGGGNYHAIVNMILKVCLELPELKTIHVVSSGKFEELSSTDRIVFHHNLAGGEIASVMSNCQLSICPASTISIESYFAKMCMVTGITAGNQQSIHDGIKRFENVVSVGNWLQVNAEQVKTTIASSVGNWNRSKTLESLDYSFNNEKLKMVFENL